MSFEFDTYCRMRPLQDPSASYTSISEDKKTITIHDPFKATDTHKFHFENIFPNNATQEDIYDTVGLNFVDKLMEGKKIGVVSYGQTGSGKSHTIFGDMFYEGRTFDRKSHGLILQFISELFLNLGEKGKKETYDVSVSFYEIYMEAVRDLIKSVQDKFELNRLEQNAAKIEGGVPGLQMPKSTFSSKEVSLTMPFEEVDYESQSLEVNDDKEGFTQIRGLTAISIQSLEEAAHLLENGLEFRKGHELKPNSIGSKSHTIFSVSLTHTPFGRTTSRLGMIYFVDLAGCENIAKSATNPMGYPEHMAIIASFDIMKKVIQGLRLQADNPVPYHEDKLTRCLHNFMGPNSIMIFLSQIYGIPSNYDELKASLQYLTSCKYKAEGKQEGVFEHSGNQEKRILQLRQENTEMRKRNENSQNNHKKHLDDIREKLGIKCDLEKVLSSRGTAKEMAELKNHKEAKERLKALGDRKEDLEKKVSKAKKDYMKVKERGKEMREGYRDQISRLNEELGKLTESNIELKIEYDQLYDESSKEREEELSTAIKDKQEMITQKVGLIHKAHDLMDERLHNVNNIKDHMDNGMREAEFNFQKGSHERAINREKQLVNLDAQYKHYLSEKEKEVHKFEEDFKEFHVKKKTEINKIRVETSKLYELVKSQAKGNIRMEFDPSTSQRQIRCNCRTRKDSLCMGTFKARQKIKSKQVKSAAIKQGSPQVGDKNTPKMGDPTIQGIDFKDTMGAAESLPPKFYETEAFMITESKVDLNVDVASMNHSDTKHYVELLRNELRKIKERERQMAAANQSDSKMGYTDKKEGEKSLRAQRDKYKKLYQKEITAFNLNQVTLEAQKRVIDKAQMEKKDVFTIGAQTFMASPGSVKGPSKEFIKTSPGFKQAVFGTKK